MVMTFLHHAKNDDGPCSQGCYAPVIKHVGHCLPVTPIREDSDVLAGLQPVGFCMTCSMLHHRVTIGQFAKA